MSNPIDGLKRHLDSLEDYHRRAMSHDDDGCPDERPAARSHALRMGAQWESVRRLLAELDAERRELRRAAERRPRVRACPLCRSLYDFAGGGVDVDPCAFGDGCESCAAAANLGDAL